MKRTPKRLWIPPLVLNHVRNAIGDASARINGGDVDEIGVVEALARALKPLRKGRGNASTQSLIVEIEAVEAILGSASKLLSRILDHLDELDPNGGPFG